MGSTGPNQPTPPQISAVEQSNVIPPEEVVPQEGEGEAFMDVRDESNGMTGPMGSMGPIS